MKSSNSNQSKPKNHLGLVLATIDKIAQDKLFSGYDSEAIKGLVIDIMTVSNEAAGEGLEPLSLVGICYNALSEIALNQAEAKGQTFDKIWKNGLQKKVESTLSEMIDQKKAPAKMAVQAKGEKLDKTKDRQQEPSQ
jgi:hypothetical protein